MRGKKNINVCIKCGSDDIVIRNCRYSSFNSGSGMCKKCGNKVISQNGPWNNDDWIISGWNFNNPTKEEEIKGLEAKIKTLKKQIKVAKQRKW